MSMSGMFPEIDKPAPPVIPYACQHKRTEGPHKRPVHDPEFPPRFMVSQGADDLPKKAAAPFFVPAGAIERTYAKEKTP